MTEPLLLEPAECVVKVDGTAVTELYRFMKKVEVKMSRASATICSIELDTFRDEQGEWSVQDGGVFQPWKELLVEAHFGDRVEEVMRGFVKEIRVQHPPDMSSSVVTVTGQDQSLLLDRKHVRKVWSTEDEQLHDGQIAEAVASDHGLDSETDDGLQNASLNQDETSINFLKRRAEANGFELFFREGRLHFHAARLEESPQPTVMVYAGASSNCLSWSTIQDGHKPDRVRVTRAADTGTDAEAEVFSPDLPLLGRTQATSAGMGHPDFEWAMNRPQGATRAEVNARAQATANANAWKIVATGELDGSLYGHVLLTHRTVDVDGVGSTYGGTYYVDEVTHAFSLEGYRQRFKLLRNATGQES